MRHLRVLIVAAVVALAFTAVLSWGSSADAQTDVEVDTGAEVNGGSSPPIINAKWELPDMRPGVDAINYQAQPPTDLNTNGIPDADDDPLTPGMQMYPDINDLPEPRRVEFWIAAEDPDGLGDIAAVWVDVFHPDGSLKYQIDLVAVNCNQIGLYDDTVTPALLTLKPVLLAAIDTGQVTLAEAQDLVIRCYKSEKKIYRGEQVLHHHQPAGTYTVSGNAQDFAAGLGTFSNTFEVLPIVALILDFDTVTGVNWGSILPGVTDWVSGDEDLLTPAKPTIKNGGNVPMQVGLLYSVMTKILPTPDPSKVITEFDGRFLGQSKDFAAGVPDWFTTLLPPCTPKQIDLSIHPPLKLPPGSYAGTVNVLGRIPPP